MLKIYINVIKLDCYDLKRCRGKMLAQDLIYSATKPGHRLKDFSNGLDGW